MNDLISIIIPCYNCEQYIRKTLKSIINQSYKYFEIIIVDDGSTDGGIDIINEILSKSNVKFSIIEQKNCGVSKARNCGLDYSSGKYVYFIDSDDFIEHNFLEEMYKKLENECLDMVFSGHDRINENERTTFTYDKRYMYIENISRGCDVIKDVFKNKVLLWTGSIIYRKELLDKNNIRYVENCSNGEDQEFWIKALFNSAKVGSVNKVLAHYLQRSKSITHSSNLSRFTVLGAVIRTKNYLLIKGMDKEIIDILDTYKYQKEFIYNFSSIAMESKDIEHLMPIIESKNIKKILKKYKIQTLNISDIKNLVAIKAYLINPYIYANILNKYRK